MSRAATVGAFLVALGWAGHARALDLHKHFLLGVRVGDYLPADEQKGGFRGFGGITEGAERAVKMEEAPTLAVSFGYGVAKFGKRANLVLEVQASRMEGGLGPETVYRDRDASTRVALPPDNVTFQNGDEEFVRMSIGDITMTPVLVNALVHWAGQGGRADFYAGGGFGVIMADVTESDEFRAFKSDFDGNDDLQVDDAFTVAVKAGANVALKRDGNLWMYFEAEFLSTGFLSSEAQVRWSSSEYLAGEQDVDTDDDNIPDVFGLPADLRIVDAGKFRLDGATIGLGIRYRFGGKKASAPAEAEESAPAAP